MDFDGYLVKCTAICTKKDGKNNYSGMGDALKYKQQILQYYGELQQLYTQNWFACGISQIDFNPDLNELRLCIDHDYFIGSGHENYAPFITAFKHAKLVDISLRMDIDNLSFNFKANT